MDRRPSPQAAAEHRRLAPRVFDRATRRLACGACERPLASGQAHCVCGVALVRLAVRG